jgi:radial spoke head protein 9
MTPQHELHENRNFYGLDGTSALSHGYWLHFRAPQSSEAKANLEEESVIFNSNFLDNLEADLPKGVWSLQLDHQKKNVNVRNMLWPGYYAFHRLSSSVFGSVYIGDGVKNADLPFMV